MAGIAVTLAPVRRGARQLALKIAAATAIVLVAGCGFSDDLTRRGFIRDGDSLCSAAIGRSFQQLRGSGAASDTASEVRSIHALAAGYASIAAGLRKLKLTDRDDPMRNAMVRRYQAAASQIDASAADAAAGDPSAQERALAVVNRLLPFAAQVRAYGFKVCGGRAAAA
jgi:type II secretory pathway component GspD/PulD (secretin)